MVWGTDWGSGGCQVEGAKGGNIRITIIAQSIKYFKNKTKNKVLCTIK